MVPDLAPGWALRTPGIAGGGTFTLTSSGLRGAPDTTRLGVLDDVLAAQDVSERAVVEFTIQLAGAGAEERGRREVGAAEVAQFDVPPPPDGHEQIVLEAGEDGTVTWHPDYENVQPGGRRGSGALRRYSIPLRRSGSRTESTERRGLFSAGARRVLKALIFPITDFALGPVEKGIARAWESKYRPYGVRMFGPLNFQEKSVDALTTEDWKFLAKGPALLFVHGTFSAAHHAFSLMKGETLQVLSDFYDGRTFAFDHWTLSHDPSDNMEWLTQQIPRELPTLELDIVCHSRGGLVARELATSLWEHTNLVRVKRIVFVATPNDGTLLAQPDHMVKMLDRYTNAIQFLPSGAVEAVLGPIVAAVKTLSHAGLEHLPGLAAVAPDSQALWECRAGETRIQTRCYGIAADWEPREDSPFFELVKEKVANQVMDRVFKNEKNDLVVPTLGVAHAQGPLFPLKNSYEFTSSAGAMHTNLFGFEETTKHLLEWLR